MFWMRNKKKFSYAHFSGGQATFLKKLYEYDSLGLVWQNNDSHRHHIQMVMSSVMLRQRHI